MQQTAVILGCGRVGSTLALMLAAEGHQVSVIDKDPDAFRRLGEDFPGERHFGQGIDLETLKRAGIEVANAFFAVTNSDNTNIMAAQIALRRFHVPRVFARIYDPLRASVYRLVGIETVCATTLMAGMFYDRLFGRPYRPVDEYLKIGKEFVRLYGADLPSSEKVEIRRAGQRAKQPDYIIVAGGGKVGSRLASVLLRQGYDVLLVEKRKERYNALKSEFGEAVFHGDACEIRTMIRLGMERADLVVAVTGDDEDNLIICQVAKKWFGVPRVIARVNDPRNEEVFRMLEVDETISATTLLFRMIQQEVPAHYVVPLAFLRRGGLEVIELTLPDDSPAAGKEVRDLDLPLGSLLVAVVNQDGAQAVTGSTVLKPGDEVVSIAPAESIEELRKALLG